MPLLIDACAGTNTSGEISFKPIEIEHELFTRTRKTQRSSWTALAHH